MTQSEIAAVEAGEHVRHERLLGPAALIDFDESLRRGFAMVDFCRYLSTYLPSFRQAIVEIDDALERYRAAETSYAEIANRIPTVFAGAARGMSTSDLKWYGSAYIRTSSWKNAIFEFTDDLLAEIRSAQLSIIVISGIPSVLIHCIPQLRAATEVYGVDLQATVEGRITGRVLSNRATDDAKRLIVDDVSTRFRCRLAVGDSSADVPLFEVSEFGIVVGTSTELSARVGTISVDPLASDRIRDRSRIREIVRMAGANG